MLELGVIDLQQKKPKDAIAMFQKAYETNPNNIRGLLGESRAYLADGQLDKSVEVVRTEVQKNPDRVDLIRELGNAQAAAGQFPQAIATYQSLLSKFKDPKLPVGIAGSDRTGIPLRGRYPAQRGGFRGSRGRECLIIR